MTELFQKLTTLEQTYLIIALVSSVILLINFARIYIRGGDIDSNPRVSIFRNNEPGVVSQFFTFRNLVGFFTLFGWMGIACLKNNVSPGFTLPIATIAGFLMMTLTFLLFKRLKTLFES